MNEAAPRDPNNTPGLLVANPADKTKTVAVTGDGNGGFSTSMSTGLSPSFDGVTTYPRGAVPFPITATTLIQDGVGKLRRIVCAAGTSVTVSLYDALNSSGSPYVDTFPLSPGDIKEFDARHSNGLYVVVAGTTPKLTIMLDPTAA